MSLFEELKRRNVFRVGIAYVLLGWVVMQAADFALDLIDAPNWVIQVFFIAGLVGLPFALFFAWAFELTPEGIKREEDVDRSGSIAPVTGRKLDRAIIVFLALAVVLLLADRYYTTSPETTPPIAANPAPAAAARDPVEQASADQEKSIAVLAFENMSPDAENEYFADGVSEEILNVLSDLPELRVIARTSAFSFKGSEATVAEIADKLDVAYVLEGSVRKAGDRVRVTAQLIDTASESHLWSETYDRQLVDIFAVQDEIARAIAGELELQLTVDQEAPLAVALTDNIDAYNKYLLGRQLWHSRTIQSLRASVDALEEAVNLDPDFAQAWAALADALVLIPEYDPDRSIDTVPLARDAVNRALELEPDLPQALTTRAYLRFMYDYDWENAEKDFLRAMALDPDYPTAQQWYGEFLAVRYRDVEGALRQFRKASELDPLAPIMWHVSGWLVGGFGRQEEAIAYYQRALEINPNLQSTYGNLSGAYARLGRYDEARRALKRFRELLDLPPAEPPTLIDAMEDPVAKTAYLDRLDRSVGQHNGATGKAMEYMVLGQEEAALDHLVLGFEEGDPYAVHVNRLEIFDPLRDDPRFQAHLARMNLWPPPE